MTNEWNTSSRTGRVAAGTAVMSEGVHTGGGTRAAAWKREDVGGCGVTCWWDGGGVSSFSLERWRRAVVPVIYTKAGVHY